MVHNTHMRDKLSTPTIQKILEQTAHDLQPSSIQCAEDVDLRRLEAEVLLAHVLKKDRTWLHTHPEEKLPRQIIERYKKFCHRRQHHEPIAYILGSKDFYGRSFLVNRHTLIPRPETELIVDLVKGAATDLEQAPLVWDVGTGSGAIALTLAQELPDSEVIASDSSRKALFIARKNATHQHAKNIHFVHGDLLNSNIKRILTSSSKPIIISANLPYLPTEDKQKLAADVVRYEPHEALFAGENGLELIRKLLEQLKKSHIRFSALFLEFDPPQAKQLHALTTSLFPSASLKNHKDLAGRNRILSVTSTEIEKAS